MQFSSAQELSISPLVLPLLNSNFNCHFLNLGTHPVSLPMTPLIPSIPNSLTPQLLPAMGLGWPLPLPLFCSLEGPSLVKA